MIPVSKTKESLQRMGGRIVRARNNVLLTWIENANFRYCYELNCDPDQNAHGWNQSPRFHIVNQLIRHLKTHLRLHNEVGSQCNVKRPQRSLWQKLRVVHVRTRWEVAVCMWRRDSSGEPNPLVLWSQASVFQTPGKPTSAMQVSQSVFCYGSQSIPILMLLSVENSKTEYWTSFSI